MARANLNLTIEVIDGATTDVNADMVLITKQEYDKLVYRDDHLELLESRGVDNWHGWCYPPNRLDYETDEEYQEAWDKTLAD